MTPPSADRESAFKHFAPLVAGIPESDLELWHYDAEILRVNTQRSLDALEPFLQATAKKMGHKKVAVERWGWKSVDEHYPSLFARVVAAPAAAAAPAAPAASVTPAVKPDP